MKNDEMILRICEDKSIRLEFFENGQKRTKVISVETLTDCISRSLAGVRLTTGLLPANALSVTMDSDNGRRYAVLEFPDERATVTYMNTEYPDFPLPRLLFGFRIEDSGRISGINIGVPDLGKLTPDTRMFVYPFSNVSRFAMCTGANSLPHIQSLQQLANLPYYILSLPDNDDFYQERGRHAWTLPEESSRPLIQDRLDSVLGRENWQNRFCTVQGKDNASTTQVCELSIYYPNRGEWITKSNGAGNTDIEPVKGGLSNAFKRAASMWGVGRYLYDLKNLWVPLKDGKYIPDDQLPILIKQYNQFVRQLLSAGNPAAGKQQAAPAVQPNPAPAPQTAPPKQTKPAQSRFPQQTPPAAKDSWTVTKLQISRGGSGAQTLITVQKPTGESVTGYIRGEAPLKTGQSIRDLKITTKNSPIVGEYNIVESYQIAA